MIGKKTYCYVDIVVSLSKMVRRANYSIILRKEHGTTTYLSLGMWSRESYIYPVCNSNFNKMILVLSRFRSSRATLE